MIQDISGTHPHGTNDQSSPPSITKRDAHEEHAPQGRSRPIDRRSRRRHGEGKPRRPRGFAAMDRKLVSEIARKGGKAAHTAGTAHEFTSEEARVAGRKGGRATHAKRRQVAEEASATRRSPQRAESGSAERQGRGGGRASFDGAREVLPLWPRQALDEERAGRDPRAGDGVGDPTSPRREADVGLSAVVGAAPAHDVALPLQAAGGSGSPSMGRCRGSAPTAEVDIAPRSAMSCRASAC